jgi:hypothetical protein
MDEMAGPFRRAPPNGAAYTRTAVR